MVAGLNASTLFVSSVSTGGITNMSEVTGVCNNNIINATKGLTQSPLVSPTAPLPLHQSNVDVPAIFGVSLTNVGALEVSIKDIDAGKHDELLFGMTNDKRKVVIYALCGMCELIEAQNALNLLNDGFNSDGTKNASSVLVTLHTSSHAEDNSEFNNSKILIYSIDDVATLFGVPLNYLKKIDDFTKDLEVGKYALWAKLIKETCSGIIDIICNRWDTLLNMQKSAPTVDDSMSIMALPSDPIVQSVDINTKSTSYARAVGVSAKDQLKLNSNIHFLVNDPVFDGVNISIPRKFFKKYGRNNQAKYRLKRIMMNNEGFLFFKFDSYAGLEAVLECSKKVMIPPIVTIYNVVTPTIEKTNIGFQTVGKKKKGKGKSNSTNGGQFDGPSVKQSLKYEPKVYTSTPKKGASNVSNTSKSSSMLKIAVIIKQRVKVNQKACILEVKRRNHEKHCSDNQYVISIKEDMTFTCPKFTQHP
nr:hypothetical protein [Tanacetum cinerariifolium]